MQYDLYFSTAPDTDFLPFCLWITCSSVVLGSSIKGLVQIKFVIEVWFCNIQKHHCHCLFTPHNTNNTCSFNSFFFRGPPLLKHLCPNQNRSSQIWNMKRVSSCLKYLCLSISTLCPSFYSFVCFWFCSWWPQWVGRVHRGAYHGRGPWEGK